MCYISSMSQLRFDQVVTRGGDRGESSLFSGERFRKDDLVFQVLGDLDELNSWLGLARQPLAPVQASGLMRSQTVLGELMALAATLDGRLDGHFDLAGRLSELESHIQDLLARTEIPAAFVNPGACESSARLDLARTVCRRAERSLVTLIRERGRVDLALAQNFVNRLSDYLFVLARHVEQPD